MTDDVKKAMPLESKFNTTLVIDRFQQILTCRIVHSRIGENTRELLLSAASSTITDHAHCGLRLILNAQMVRCFCLE